ncbi:diaminopimelate epimerase [Streptomyces sp. NPDC050085]|uniref:diaminopimelate epimerase n=1 Tax=Streptomyces sp. NPDC050085 TaxID=3365600 RepID=UPI003787B9B6
MNFSLPFTKGNGAGNDFLVLHDPFNQHPLTPTDVTHLCDRRTGLGSDGLLRAVRCENLAEGRSYVGHAEWFMDYRNADGSLGQMCGNGIRVLARHLTHHGHTAPGRVTLATRAGPRSVAVPDTSHTGPVAVKLPRPQTEATATALTVTSEGRSWPAQYVDVGNPHAVAFVDNPADAGTLTRPPQVAPPPAHGITVEFVQIIRPGHLMLRVHERGVGETPSCGTGACAAATAAELTGASAPDGRYRVDSPGGTLHVAVARDGSGTMTLTGPTALTLTGLLTPPRPETSTEPITSCWTPPATG